ncbi:unnamed protein product [Schistosoma curassoni]|uniref:Piwi domain-containing protein n=1 Tax=Schistosoma curassoni TaxID=6186 RepID=A0A183KPQ1_9TREM|nr:unnamed protein product [Schistosoma curassoni]
MICVGGVDANDPKFANQSIDQLVQDKQCAPYVYHSRSMLGRCIPSQVSRLMGNGTGQVRDETGKPILLMDAKNQEVNGMEVVKSRKLVLEFTTFFEKVVADLSQTWHVILVYCSHNNAVEMKGFFPCTKLRWSNLICKGSYEYMSGYLDSLAMWITRWRLKQKVLCLIPQSKHQLRDAGTFS